MSRHSVDLQRLHDIAERDAAQDAVEHDRGRPDDDEAEREPDPVPADFLVDHPRGRAERMEHSSSLGSVNDRGFLFFRDAPGRL